MFELLVAIGVIALILSSLVSLATLSVRNAGFARNESEAARLGQDASEWLRGERNKDWDDFIAMATTGSVATTSQIARLCVKGVSWPQTHLGDCFASDTISNLFLRTIDFELQDTNGDTYYDLANAVITVHWTDGQGYHEIKNSTYYTDWRIQ
ncbi:hypothetical protein A2125_01715 [Candidatus Woesebacteria bacterium GWB1_43_5]|uniref:Type 4 fimbrial biogenesis protein PilX N-terminal domain-containing protein n=1 Tax=Candidatus Woesebacteria bacterium GWB1_43_5 TaxID=1802474 RepID=A0A1F7WR05_9BACT|nr:MAG: hypothetical protein A2125_01715 [Candidatus Woesebacteria bacterium GWB1_43_5]